MNPFNITDKTILITGASSGIGRQCAISIAAMGANIVLIGRNTDRLEETKKMMERPDKHLCFSLDLTDYERIPDTIKTIVENIGRINGLVNCAGISTTLPVKMVTNNHLDYFFQTNVYSSYILTKEVTKISNFAKEGGSIVFISSIMGLVGESGKSLYSMTKGAIQSGVRSLACELAKKNIRVNTISPGVIITPINNKLPHIADPDKRNQLEKMHLLGLGECEDIANACIYLLSDASKWVTGHNLVVDGGYTAR